MVAKVVGIRIQQTIPRQRRFLLISSLLHMKTASRSRHGANDLNALTAKEQTSSCIRFSLLTLPFRSGDGSGLVILDRRSRRRNGKCINLNYLEALHSGVESSTSCFFFRLGDLLYTNSQGVYRVSRSHSLGPTSSKGRTTTVKAEIMTR